MEPDYIEIHTESFAKELVKAFVMSAVATAGMLTGFLVSGYVNNILQERKNKQEIQSSES